MQSHKDKWIQWKKLNAYDNIILLCTHLYHSYFQYLSITWNAFIDCYIRRKKYIFCVNSVPTKVKSKRITLSQITLCARLIGSSSKHHEQPRFLPWGFTTTILIVLLCSFFIPYWTSQDRIKTITDPDQDPDQFCSLMCSQQTFCHEYQHKKNSVMNRTRLVFLNKECDGAW